MSHIFAQAQVDALEMEKDSLGQQIDSLMVDRQNLLQVKMSLGLEVATYRYLSSKSSSTPAKYNLSLLRTSEPSLHDVKYAQLFPFPL